MLLCQDYWGLPATPESSAIAHADAAKVDVDAMILGTMPV
jgi:hypothetical protein